jgi:hypothetical protein
MAEKRRKISTGPNSRPMDESIAQTAGGIPDDSGGLPEALEGLEAANDAGAAERVFGAAPATAQHREEAGGGRLQDKPEGSRRTVEEALRQQEQRER